MLAVPPWRAGVLGRQASAHCCGWMSRIYPGRRCIPLRAARFPNRRGRLDPTRAGHTSDPETHTHRHGLKTNVHGRRQLTRQRRIPVLAFNTGSMTQACYSTGQGLSEIKRPSISVATAKLATRFCWCSLSISSINQIKIKIFSSKCLKNEILLKNCQLFAFP